MTSHERQRTAIIHRWLAKGLLSSATVIDILRLVLARGEVPALDQAFVTFATSQPPC